MATSLTRQSGHADDSSDSCLCMCFCPVIMNPSVPYHHSFWDVLSVSWSPLFRCVLFEVMTKWLVLPPSRAQIQMLIRSFIVLILLACVFWYPCNFTDFFTFCFFLAPTSCHVFFILSCFLFSICLFIWNTHFHILCAFTYFVKISHFDWSKGDHFHFSLFVRCWIWQITRWCFRKV